MNFEKLFGWMVLSVEDTVFFNEKLNITLIKQKD